MGLDRTILFHEILNEYLKSSKSSIDARKSSTSQSKERDELIIQAKATAQKISIFKEYLVSTKANYCQAIQSDMNQAEKDSFDLMASRFIKVCLERINILKSQSDSYNDQVLKTHYQSVVWYLNKELAQVSKTVKEMQEIRYHQQKEMHQSFLHKSNDTDEPLTANWSEKSLNLTKQEQLLLEEENQALMNDFQGILDELQNTEKNLTEVSNLQQILEHHVATQAEEIEYIYSEAVEATDKIKEGNKHLLSSKERNSDSRKYVLLVMLLFTFVILFLDWYG